jgi:predicted phage terminase large subunit-like protein
MSNSPYAQYQYILRNDFCSFIQRCFYEINPQTPFLMNWHIERLAEKLEACRRGKIKRLVVNIPPRHLKSICASVALPAFWLGHAPSVQILCVSYGQDLSDKLARDSKNIMTSSFYKNLFNTRLSAEKQSVQEFVTTRKGYRLSTSVGGVVTGRGADVIIIDDPLKPDDAFSEVLRNGVNEWYDNTLYSRLNNKVEGCIIIIMQRLHEDDLVGHVLRQEGWEVVSFPAIAEQEEEYVIKTVFGSYRAQRKLGDILHPARESKETLDRLRRTLGEYNFLSQYQQSPTPPGGAMVKSAWLKYYAPSEQPGTFDLILQSWDTANKVTELSDYSVCTTWGKKGRLFYLLNVFRRRMEYPYLKRAVQEQANTHKATTILIEDKASGTQLIQELKQEGVRGVTAYEPAGKDKAMRLIAQTAAIENGQVLFPREAHWLAEYVRELTSFPGGKHDDQVDSTAQALEWLQRPGFRGFFNMDIPTPPGKGSLVPTGGNPMLDAFSTHRVRQW